MTLLDQISQALGASGALGELAGSIGASDAETETLLGAGVPAVLAGLGQQATNEGGIGALLGLLGDDGGGFIDHLGSFFGQGDKTGLASTLIGSIFGSQRGAVESQISNSTGGAISQVSRFLPMLAPAVMSLLGKITSDDGTDAEALTAQLGEIGAASPFADILGASTDEDRSGFVDGIAALREAGGLSALLPASGTNLAAAAAGTAGAAGATATALAAPHRDDDDRDRSGLAWLLPILAPLGLLILGLVLWQCGSTNDEPQIAVEVTEAAEPEPEPTAIPEPTSAPEPTATPEPEPTATPEPEPEPEPFTIADLASGTPYLSNLVDLAGQLGLAEAISDPDAGPFTIFAPTNSAFRGAGGTLERLDDTQTRTTVTYHVVPGIYRAEDLVEGLELTTLAGETLVIGADGALPGGVQVVGADLVADNGIVHTVGGVLLPGSIQRTLATADINELFALEPIQFASGSAEILAESIPTLDNAVEVLTNVPEGTKLEVQGHTDSDGDDALNQTLSEQRAAAVVAYLTDNGVDIDLLEPRGYGETQLKVDPDPNPEDKAQNRRIEFVDISEATP